MSGPFETTTLEVRKDNWGVTRLVTQQLAEPVGAEVILKVNRMALTANNISYAGAGIRSAIGAFSPQKKGGAAFQRWDGPTWWLPLIRTLPLVSASGASSPSRNT